MSSSKVLAPGKHPKSALNEIYINADPNLKPTWETKWMNAGEYPPRFSSCCKVFDNGKLLEAMGHGSTKKEAEKEASLKMLTMLELVKKLDHKLSSPQPQPIKSVADEAESGDPDLSRNMESLSLEGTEKHSPPGQMRVNDFCGQKSSDKCEVTFSDNSHIVHMLESKALEDAILNGTTEPEDMNRILLTLDLIVSDMHGKLKWSFTNSKPLEDAPPEIIAFIELTFPFHDKLMLSNASFHGIGNTQETAKVIAAKRAIDFFNAEFY